MEKANKKRTRLLTLAILSAFLFAGGIPAIIVGAGRATWLMIVGIVLTAADFYACPLLFVSYGGAVSLCRTVRAVEEEHLYTVKEIAMQTRRPEGTVKEELYKCIDAGYLCGYLFDGENLTLNSNRSKESATCRVLCESCGAIYEYPVTEEGKCPYCGTPAKQNGRK